MKISWADYTDIVAADMALDEAVIYRGQRSTSWPLVSSLHRTTLVGSAFDLKGYADVIVPRIHDALATSPGRSWDLKNEPGEFLAFLQRHGFPTPLLEWTPSPYVAAFFAFEAVDRFHPQHEAVAIFAFNRRDWSSSIKRVNDFTDPAPHLSTFTPRDAENPKLANQQACFMVTNVVNIDAHIRFNEWQGKSFLTKYELDARERPRVIRQLALMGLNAETLMPAVEAVDKKAVEDFVAMLLSEHPTTTPVAIPNPALTDGW